jgi:hypothetical protein
MSTREERAQEARDDIDPNCIGCGLGIWGHAHDEETDE